MTVSLGGDGTTRDIAIAEDVSGNKITVNNISESPISVTMSAAPSTNSRIDLIVAYVDNPPQGSSTSVDNPGACGLIKVDGTAAADPVAPNDSAIRTAITADGASGSTAYYVVLATITIASGTTDLTADNIAAGPSAGIGSQNIDFTTFVNKPPISLGLSITGGSFMANTFGLAVVQTAVSNNQSVKVKVNNILICESQGGAAAFTWIPISVFLASGDVLDVTTSDGGGSAQVSPARAWFMPIN